MIQGAVAVGMVAPGLEFSPLPGVEQVLPGADKLSVDDALAMGQDVLGRVAVAVRRRRARLFVPDRLRGLSAAFALGASARALTAAIATSTSPRTVSSQIGRTACRAAQLPASHQSTPISPS